jgi:pimeloyl-ACP methyl ester carboxylesterase
VLFFACMQTAGCGKPVLLVHGFGASAGHYRKTIPYLAQNGFKVRSRQQALSVARAVHARFLLVHIASRGVCKTTHDPAG